MKPETELDIPELKRLLEAADCTPWSLQHGLMGDSLYITSFMREGFGGRRDGDGPICHVSTERHHFEREGDGLRSGRSSSWKTPIKTAQADAKLIVAAVNALPELLRRVTKGVDEAAWLIEFPADRYGPIRYWAAGEPPVISASDATRFSRKKDAEAIIRLEGLKSGRAAEHMWMAPKPKKRPASADRSGEAGETALAGSTEGESGVGAEGAETPKRQTPNDHQGNRGCDG